MCGVISLDFLQLNLVFSLIMGWNTPILWVFLCVFVAGSWNSGCSAAPNYLIGAGIADMTGPAADVNFVSYDLFPSNENLDLHCII